MYTKVVEVGPTMTQYVFSGVDKNKPCCFSISYISANWKESELIGEVCGCEKSLDKKKYPKH